MIVRIARAKVGHRQAQQKPKGPAQQDWAFYIRTWRWSRFLGQSDKLTDLS
jgi:hypothetical protein